MKRITNTTQRQKAQYIYDTYFDTDSELVLDFGFIDTIGYYSGMSEKKTTKLTKKIEEIGFNLFEEMGRYDMDLLNNKK